MNGRPDPAALVVRRRREILALVRAEAKGLLRYESADDLVQGIQLRAIERGGTFEYRSEAEFLAWLRRTARSHLADRRNHWGALKRRSGRLLRYTAGAAATADPAAVPEPAADGTGPSTFAARREQVVLATKALDLLLPRDRDLVRLAADGLGTSEQAERLGLSVEAAGRARRRAFDRFRKAYELVLRGASP